MNNAYPIDINGIKSIGIEDWLLNYYVPVTGKEFYEIHNSVLHSYLSELKSCNDGIAYSIGIACLNIIPNGVSNFLTEIYGLLRLKERGCKYLVGDEKSGISFNTSSLSFSRLDLINLAEKYITELNTRERIKNILRTLKYNLTTPYLLNKDCFKNVVDPHYFIGYRAQQEVVSFCKESAVAPIHLSPMLFIRSQFKDLNLEPQLSQLIEFLNNFLLLVKEKYSIINESRFVFLRDTFEKALKYILIIFKQNLNVLIKHKPARLLATGLGHPIHRLFCSAWRYSGGKVIGFAHGNAYSHSYMPNTIKFMPLVNEYVTSSQGHAEIVKQAAKDFFPDLEAPGVAYVKDEFYKNKFRQFENDLTVSKIKKVMVVGSVVKNFFAIDAEIHNFASLYNDLQLIKLLKRKGYRVIYKPRLETINEIEGIFENYADLVLKERFEDVFKYADCLLFSIPYSTTFGFSLLTNKPIVLINSQGYTWYPRVFELMKKRCSIVNATSVDGKTIFNENELIDSVESSINNVNYDILYEFAF